MMTVAATTGTSEEVTLTATNRAGMVVGGKIGIEAGTEMAAEMETEEVAMIGGIET
jgi:hypothetical protein